MDSTIRQNGSTKMILVFSLSYSKNESNDLKLSIKHMKSVILNNSIGRFDVRVHNVCNTVQKSKPNEEIENERMNTQNRNKKRE